MDFWEKNPIELVLRDQGLQPEGTAIAKHPSISGGAPNAAAGAIRVLEADAPGLVGGPNAGRFTFFHGTTDAGAEGIVSHGIKPVGVQEGDFFATTNPARAAEFGGGKIVEISLPEDVFLDLWISTGLIKRSPAHADSFYVTPEGQKLINAVLGK
jgi:hypothetical protein